MHCIASLKGLAITFDEILIIDVKYKTLITVTRGYAHGTHLRLFKALSFLTVSKNGARGISGFSKSSYQFSVSQLRGKLLKPSSGREIFRIFFFFFFEANRRDSFLIRICNDLTHEHEGKKQRGKGAVLKGACNCSQGCITEVEREGPRGGHEGGKRTALCARRYVDSENGEKRDGVTCTCRRSRASVSGRVCNTEETRIRRAALANESTRESKLGH